MKLDPKLLPSKPDSRDRVASLVLLDTLPASFDLKSDVFEVENQLNFNSCTANAGCSALELMYKKHNMLVDLSRMFLYYYERQIGLNKGDTGAYPRNIGKALNTYGVCPEVMEDYLAENIDKEPSDTSKQAALFFKILSYEQITPLGGDILQQIKNSIVQGVPVLLAIAIHSGMQQLGNNWKTHTWDWNTNPHNPLLGYHEVLIIGYDDESKRLLCENSWGPDWADGGFFGIPYEMITSESFGEMWILTPNYDTTKVPENKIEKKDSADLIMNLGLWGGGIFLIYQALHLGLKLF